MRRPAVIIAAVLIAAAGVTGLDGAPARSSAQRAPANRDEALAIIRQLTNLIEGNTQDNPSLFVGRKLLVDTSATIDRLLIEFDEAATRAADNYEAIAPALTQQPGEISNACEVLAASSADTSRISSSLATLRTAIGNQILDTAVPPTTCRATDALRLRAATQQLASAKDEFLAGVTSWAGAAQQAGLARSSVTLYRHTLDALDAIDDVSNRLAEVVRRADRAWSDYELWTTTAALQIAAVRKTAAAFGIEREVSALEAKAVAASAEFAALSLVFKRPGFPARMAAVAKTRADAAARHEVLTAVRSRFECTAPADAVPDIAAVAADVAGAIYRIDEANRSWLAAADRCEKKKEYIKQIALGRTFLTVKVGDTVPRPQFLQASPNPLSDPADVGDRAAWTGVQTPFTPTPAQANMIFFVTATIEGRATTMTIFVEPARSAVR